VIHTTIFSDFFSPLLEILINTSVKATEFPFISPIQTNFPDAWRAQEIIKFGRGIDDNFYPVSKKGTETHVNAMHAANLLLALSCKASRGSIQKVLKMRYLLRSQNGGYFMNDFAEYLTNPESFLAIDEIRISTDRPYVEIIHSIEKPVVYSSDKFERQDAENFTILFQKFLSGCSSELNHRRGSGAGPSFTEAEEIRAHVRSFKKIQY
jgi:hypothetical protein